MFYSSNSNDFFDSPKSKKNLDPVKENFEPNLLKTIKKSGIGRVPLADITPKGEEGRRKRTIEDEGTERKLNVRLFR
jgi:hypothetical protein